MEAIECLHCWTKLGIVEDLRRAAEDVPEEILMEMEEAGADMA